MAKLSLLANGSSAVVECFRKALPYQASWVDSKGTRCFQVVEAPHPELLSLWVSRWDDLIDFEIVPVLTSTDFWAQVQLE